MQRKLSGRQYTKMWMVVVFGCGFWVVFIYFICFPTLSMFNKVTWTIVQWERSSGRRERSPPNINSRELWVYGIWSLCGVLPPCSPSPPSSASRLCTWLPCPGNRPIQSFAVERPADDLGLAENKRVIKNDSTWPLLGNILYLFYQEAEWGWQSNLSWNSILGISGTARTNDHKLGGLPQWQLIVSQFGRQEVGNRGAVAGGFFRRLWGGVSSVLCPLLPVVADKSGHLLACHCVTWISLPPCHMAFFPCVCVSPSLPLPLRSPVIGFRDHPSPG